MASDSLSSLLGRLKPIVEKTILPLAAPHPEYVLFFSVSDGKNRARTTCVTAKTFAEAWFSGVQTASNIAAENEVLPQSVRIDWVENTEKLTWKDLRKKLVKTKRNYFRHGISLDADFTQPFLEAELNANAALYGGAGINHAVLNESNFGRLVRQRHGIQSADFHDEQTVHVFASRGVFASAGEGQVYPLYPSGPDAGRRVIDRLSIADVDQLVENGSRYLASQVDETGRFAYGWHPCFDRPINTYNTLRHASSLYSMIEAWEVTRDPSLKAAIDRGLDCLTRSLIRTVEVEPQGTVAYLIDAQNEIKLGGNAVCLLALVKYTELTGTDRYHALLEQLALGILRMQNPETGQFSHVLHFPSLAVKDEFRIIYYDGEAAFGLMRLYGLTGDPRWIEAVERGFDHFISAEHWKAHDHWLSYCVNELTRHRPNERYFRFGIQNVADYLDFVRTRITTFPTLLELMMAAREMLTRIDDIPAFRPLLAGIDLDGFQKALDFRAHHLLNGHFWPELAMFFQNPARITGSFFIRHHAFRIRIDDVEHYLSGFVAYRRYLRVEEQFSQLVDRYKPRSSPQPPLPDSAGASSLLPAWTADDVVAATNGTWMTPPPEGWRATTACLYAPAMKKGGLVAVRLDHEAKGVTLSALKTMGDAPSALMTTDPSALPPTGLPVLQVPDVMTAVQAFGEYARRQMTGKILAVTGSAGKTTTTAMLAHALRPWGAVATNSHNANLPAGVAWNLASIGWDVPHIVLELAIGKMGVSARLARPDVAIFTNILPVHMGEGTTLDRIAATKSAIFSGMKPGSIAILNRDMAEWALVHAEAAKRDIQIVHYGKTPESAFQLLDYQPENRRVVASIHGERIDYEIGAAGAHMALNSLAVLAALSTMAYELQPAIRQLATFEAVAGRGEETTLQIDGKTLTIIDDAYNANPGSMQAALVNLSEKKQALRRIAILGEMAELGPEEEKYHTELASFVKDRPIDQVHVCGPLYENFWAELPSGQRGQYAKSLDELKSIRSTFADGDTLLLKGSHSRKIHEIVDWLKQAATPVTVPDDVAAQPVKPASPRQFEVVLPRHISALAYDCETQQTLFSGPASDAHPPASITKLLTLALIEDRLEELKLPATTTVTVSPEAATVNSQWGFEAGEVVAIGTLMAACAVVSSNEASNALAQWHSGSMVAFTEGLNERAKAMGLNDTRFSSPSGLGRNQSITTGDALTLARTIFSHYPRIAALCAERSFTWKGKRSLNPNTLLAEIDGADGLKTGSLAGRGTHIVFSYRVNGRRIILVVLGAQTRIERDDAIKSLVRACQASSVE